MIFRKFQNYLVFLILLNTGLVKAQVPGKEAWHWQFGQNAAIDFSSGTPVSGTCAINTTEGCASMSDPNTGQLLFYTDGTKVWDKNNNQMPNGFGMIGGQGTSTQAALIVPKPGSPTIYYLISADQGGYISPPNQGVNYSVVDMSLNGGFGDVTIKNQSLTAPPTTEKLTAVRHCNGIDYWIITHPFNSNAFNVYLLTAAGINPTPIISNVGTIQSNISGTYGETLGYLKASPNGKKLACAVYQMVFLEIFDFDNSSGIVSNPIKITYPNYENDVYGVAFSADNSKLYTTLEGGGLFQYDLSSNIPSTIISSKTNIPYPNQTRPVGTMQLAIDGKIYLSFDDSMQLSVINNPNKLGLSCNFQLNGPALLSGSKCRSGLPNFIDANNPYPNKTYNTSLCAFPAYVLNGSSGNNNYQWSDGSTAESISINTFGNYWVSFIDSIGCKEVDTFHILQVQPPLINILSDTSQCNNLVMPVTVNAYYPNTTSYVWNDGFSSFVHTIINPGNYWVDFTLNNFCVSRDSFSYIVNNVPFVNLGNDTSFCLGNLSLNAFNPLSTYLWSTGQTTSNIIVTSPNTYSVKVFNQYGCINSDTLIVHPDFHTFDFTLPNIITPNNDGINDFIDFGKYQFSTLQLEIYNRWGKKIFESTNSDCIWKPNEDDGVYFLVANYEINCGVESQKKSFKEFITLVK